MIDSLIAFRVLYKLVTPFNKTEAFKLGIIDEKGKLLRKMDTLKTQKEKDAYDMLDRLVFNLKRLLSKLPAGETQLASIAAAYFLVKEHYETEEDLPEDYLEEKLTFLSSVTLVEETAEVMEFLSLFEDAPANATGPAVSSDEPVIHKKKKRFANIDITKAIA